MESRKGTLEALEVSSQFWSGRRVLITGHTGFKGSWMSLWLQSLGAKLMGYSLAPPTNPSLFESAGVGKGMESQISDVRDSSKLQETLLRFGPEVIFHMAAQPLVRYSYTNPLETYETNVMGTANLLEAVRKISGVRAVVIVTSDKCYENREWHWGYRENEPMGGYDPYSSSKGCAELVTAAFRQSFFNPLFYAEHGVGIASARAGNVIGGGDWAADRLIPDVMRAVNLGEPVLVRNPHAIRPWQHVLEPLNGYIMLAEQLCKNGPHFSEAWNFGPDISDARPVSWIVKCVTDAWGAGACWELDAEPALHEAHFLKLDSSKARTLLGWEPRWSLAETLNHIVSWYRGHGSGKDMRKLSLDQIEIYQSMCV